MNDPESAANGGHTETPDQYLAGLPQVSRHRTLGETENGDPGIFPRLEDQWVTEVQIERDEAALLALASGDQLMVTCPGKVLLRDGGDVMTSGAKERGASFA